MDPSSGGPCQGIRNSVPEMLKMGIQNEVATLDAPKSAFIGSDPFPVHALGPGKTSWMYSPRLIPWLIDNLLDYNVVIVHGLWNYHAYAVRRVFDRARRHTGVRQLPSLLVMPHGMLDPYFQKASGRQIKAIRNWLYWKVIEHYLIEKADVLLFTCQQELLLAGVTFRPYRPRLAINVGYGIANPPLADTGMTLAFHKNCPNLHGKPYWLFLGRIHIKKGILLLLRAYHQLLRNQGLDQSGDGNTLPQLVIAGPGFETVYGRQLETYVESNPELRPNVHFAGMLIGEAKWGALYGCDSFILPSHQENFGIAVVEAMACSKAVLISNRVNIWREISEDRAGIVADDCEAGIYSLLKKWIMLSPTQRNEMHVNAAACFRKRYTIEAHIRNLKKVIQD
jgi:glycosyltransferase involved in cell wall biosynthesis